MENRESQRFNSERSGSLVKNLTGELSYYSFKPSPLPPVPSLEIN